MAITKTYTIDKIEVVSTYKIVQVKQLLVISENGQEISRNAHRYILPPDADITNEPQEVQNICNAVWTQDVKDAWIAFKQEQENRLG
jgi:hypothetical protein